MSNTVKGWLCAIAGMVTVAIIALIRPDTKVPIEEMVPRPEANQLVTLI